MAKQPVIYENDLPIYKENKEQEWAALQLFEMAHAEPKRALDLMFFISINCDDAIALDLLMSGPFETLMNQNSNNAEFMDKFNWLVESNKKFAEIMNEQN